MTQIKLGYSTGYWSAGPPSWSAGGDPGGRTPRLRLRVDGRGLRLRRPHAARLVGRPHRAHPPRHRASSNCPRARPAATAMAAITLDHLSGGRFILGLGASGPQVVEGWYGQPYPRPLARTREYVDVIRRIVARERARRAPRRVLRPPAAGRAGARQGRSSRPSTRCAPTSRSSSPPRVRRTSPSPARSATAGCRCSSPPRRTTSTAGASPRASPRAARPARRIASRSSRT